MGRKCIKTTYNEPGTYNSIEQKTLYAILDSGTDTVVMKDENGNTILALDDDTPNNIVDAINRLFHNYTDEDDNLLPNVSMCTDDDLVLIGEKE